MTRSRFCALLLLSARGGPSYVTSTFDVCRRELHLGECLLGWRGVGIDLDCDSEVLKYLERPRREIRFEAFNLSLGLIE